MKKVLLLVLSFGVGVSTFFGLGPKELMQAKRLVIVVCDPYFVMKTMTNDTIEEFPFSFIGTNTFSAMERFWSNYVEDVQAYVTSNVVIPAKEYGKRQRKESVFLTENLVYNWRSYPANDAYEAWRAGDLKYYYSRLGDLENTTAKDFSVSYGDALLMVVTPFLTNIETRTEVGRTANYVSYQIIRSIEMFLRISLFYKGKKLSSAVVSLYPLPKTLSEVEWFGLVGLNTRVSSAETRQAMKNGVEKAFLGLSPYLPRALVWSFGVGLGMWLYPMKDITYLGESLPAKSPFYYRGETTPSTMPLFNIPVNFLFKLGASPLYIGFDGNFGLGKANFFYSKETPYTNQYNFPDRGETVAVYSIEEYTRFGGCLGVGTTMGFLSGGKPYSLAFLVTVAGGVVNYKETFKYIPLVDGGGHYDKQSVVSLSQDISANYLEARIRVLNTYGAFVDWYVGKVFSDKRSVLPGYDNIYFGMEMGLHLHSVKLFR